MVVASLETSDMRQQQSPHLGPLPRGADIDGVQYVHFVGWWLSYFDAQLSGVNFSCQSIPRRNTDHRVTWTTTRWCQKQQSDVAWNMHTVPLCVNPIGHSRKFYTTQPTSINTQLQSATLHNWQLINNYCTVFELNSSKIWVVATNSYWNCCTFLSLSQCKIFAVFHGFDFTRCGIIELLNDSTHSTVITLPLRRSSPILSGITSWMPTLRSFS